MGSMQRMGSRCRSTVRLAFALTLATAAGCSDSISPPDAARLLIVAGDDQQVAPGGDAPDPLRVRAVDSEGKGLHGVSIRWTVTLGQATTAPPESMTDREGVAESRVRGVASVGTIVVRASVEGSTAPELTAIFTVETVDPCESSTLPLFPAAGTVTGALRDSDCEFSDRSIWDFHVIRIEAQEALAMHVHSDSLTPQVGIWSSDLLNRATDVEGVRETRMKVLLAPGLYAVGVGTFVIGERGPYDLSISRTTESAEVCQLLIVVRGISTVQQLVPSDCGDPSGASYDMFSLGLHNERVILSHFSSAFAPRLRLVHSISGDIVADARAEVGGSANIDFTSESRTMYWIHASSTFPGQGGAYTLTIAHAPSSGASARKDSGPVRLAW